MWDTYYFEKLLLGKGCQWLAGIDEVGRGALAGPVVSAAVILNPAQPIDGIKDSKVLTPLQRNLLAEKIKETALAVSVGVADQFEVDRVNILQATIKSMVRAVQGLPIRPDWLLIDALELSELDTRQMAIIDGDARSVSIAAASIVAKVTRDAFMVACGEKYPLYKFASNKGYGSAEHLQALTLHGPCELHRKTFRGVKENLKE
jgi:ribonuclease HII